MAKVPNAVEKLPKFTAYSECERELTFFGSGPRGAVLLWRIGPRPRGPLAKNAAVFRPGDRDL